MRERDVQRARAAQVGQLMRSYRESFSPGGGRRGLTQEALLERMGLVDRNYAERYSHATVSRWESGGTLPTTQRLKIFGKALNLSQTEVAGLILLAGLAADFRTALGQVMGSDSRDAISIGVLGPIALPVDSKVAASPTTDAFQLTLTDAFRFGLLRVLPLGMVIAGGYLLSLYGWNDVWVPSAYITFAIGIVLAQGFLLPDRAAGLREFFWVSLFFLLTTPLLQFSPILLDHYNFHTIGNLAGTQVPYVLALFLNLVLASSAGLMFQVLWQWQYSGDRAGGSALRRAACVVLPPVIAVYAVTVVITNISVSIQMAILLPVLAAVFIALLVLGDPAFNSGGRDRLFLLWTTSVAAMVSATLGIVAIMTIYLSPDLARILPDHNLSTLLGDRFLNDGLWPRRSAGPAELGIHVARDLDLRLHVLRCRR